MDSFLNETSGFVLTIKHRKMSVNFRKMSVKSQNFEIPLFGELSRSSRDSFESDSDSKESWDDRLNSPKSGISCFYLFLSYSRLLLATSRIAEGASRGVPGGGGSPPREAL